MIPVEMVLHYQVREKAQSPFLGPDDLNANTLDSLPEYSQINQPTNQLTNKQTILDNVPILVYLGLIAADYNFAENNLC